VSIVGRAVTTPTSVKVASLNLTGGASLNLAANGNLVLRTSWLSISSNSKLDLNDNDLIVDYTGATPMNDVATKLIAGHGATPAGIYSPQANSSGGLRTLGIAEARDVVGISGAQTATFSGQTVDATTILVKFTYAGDANLDGTINADDYASIDFHARVPGAFAYFNGDFNMDGEIDADDYALIDFNNNAQGAPL
jgi:hypothetical protein